MTRIGFVRHGSTAWNKEGRAQGNADIPLDEEGLFQASKLAERLSNENWDFIYSSDLLRAKQTAEIIGNKMGNKQVLLEQRLREVGGGQIEGTIEQERVTKWGSNWRELDLGIEKAESVIERGQSFIDEVTKNHHSQNILIVSHGGFIKYLLKELVPHLDLEASIKNTSLTKLLKTTDGWDWELFNCSSHLDDVVKN
ncbi:histidine phosphatase family protein [Heyndrickxia sp. NPDC080065]|uniref:histidine phosphatase family protein n=1 Tax=Heyndrickxia sp. NPDC080065 TaxID=3390568 RepID=UPI003D019963